MLSTGEPVSAGGADSAGTALSPRCGAFACTAVSFAVYGEWGVAGSQKEDEGKRFSHGRILPQPRTVASELLRVTPETPGAGGWKATRGLKLLFPGRSPCSSSSVEAMRRPSKWGGIPSTWERRERHRCAAVRWEPDWRIEVAREAG